VLSPTVIASSIFSQGSSFFQGPSFADVTNAIGVGVAQWAIGNPANLMLMGVTTGTLGAGLVQGTLLVQPNPNLLYSALVAAGVDGPNSFQMANSVALGVAQAFSSAAQYTGPSAGVSLGTDASKVVMSNAATLIASLNQSFQAQFGSSTPLGGMLAVGLGSGISSMLMFGIGTGVVTSPGSSPFPGVGTSPTSVVI
jgi:hypothetical protein